jgi:transcriptional regulator with XRE-family HTH domain
MSVAFNERLRRLREAAGLSQEALGRAAGLSTSAISKLEQRALMDPSWSTVVKLAEALGVDCTRFLDGNGAAPAPAAEEPKKKPGRPQKGK